MNGFLTNDDVVLITGTSSGVGLELAKIFRDQRCKVVLTALPGSIHLLAQEGIEESEDLMIFPLDVRSHSESQRMIAKIEDMWGGVSVLINNAGISYRSVIEEMTAQDEIRQMEVNYLGPMSLIRAVLPKMRQNRRGRIINVSSVGGMMAMPTMSSYSASKFALEGASEALWYEMKPWNIQVSLIKPGFINSLAFKKVFYAQGVDIENSPYSAYYFHMTRFIEKLMTRSPDTSISVALKILKVVQSHHPKLHYPATWDAWIFYYLRRLMPSFLYYPLLYNNLPGLKYWVQKRS